MSQITAVLYNRKVAPFVFLAPFLVLFLIFKVWPVIQAVNVSFVRFEGVQNQTWVGLQNYDALFSNPRFFTALRNTTVYTIGTLMILIPLPLILAVLLDSGRVVKRTVFRVILFLPALTSLVVVGAVFRLILGREGFLNSVLTTFLGIQPLRWLEVAELTLPSLILLAAWRWTGVNIMYFNAGLVNIPQELYEAAAIDGANAFQMFWRITLPLLRPTTLFVLILSIIGGFQVFVEPFILFVNGESPGNSALTIAVLIYRTAFLSFQFGPAAAMGVILALIIFALSLIQFRFFGTLRREA
jgi:arabinosaccharide transport system permease protein